MAVPDDYDWDDDYNYTCDNVGMGGGCGPECPVYTRGDCNIENEIDDIAIECAIKNEIDDDILNDIAYEAVQEARKDKSFDAAMEMFEKK